MILSAHQPAYLPWLGYLDKIIRSDVFVFLDDVQYEKNSFINRNKIKTPKGAMWLTIPVKLKGHLSMSIKEMEIDKSKKWQIAHLKTIYLNYKKASRFEMCYSKLEKLYEKEYKSLADLCWDQLIFWLNEFQIDKRIIRSSELKSGEKKSGHILDICKKLDANYYLSGALGKNYLREEEFKKHGIEIGYQDYKSPIYPQLWGNFIPNLGILDLWMNTDQHWLITGFARDYYHITNYSEDGAKKHEK